MGSAQISDSLVFKVTLDDGSRVEQDPSEQSLIILSDL
jgi:hypothetical protein